MVWHFQRINQITEMITRTWALGLPAEPSAHQEKMQTMTSDFHDLSAVYYTLMHIDILLNARHFTSRTTFTLLAVGPKWSRSVMWHDRKNTNKCGEVSGSLRSRFGVALRSAGTVSIYCPTGQLIQGECFYSLLNERSAANVLLQNS